MRMSTRGRYGLRAMFELALRHGGPPARLRDIAQCQDIPLAYLRELMTTLAARGLVRAVRGPKGGYVLSRDPAAITVQEIVEPLEGPIVLVDCTVDPAICNRADGCVARRLWSRLSADLRETMSRTTLASLVDEPECDGYAAEPAPR
jgi:Rrf2 family transcriptional regulator, cysteine metabolism repressor